MLHETETYATPFAADDQYIEFDPSDPSFGEPEGWPAWTDADRYEPSPEDVAWLAEQTEEWIEYEAWSRRLEELAEACDQMDRLEGMHGPCGVRDEDVAAAGLAVG